MRTVCLSFARLASKTEWVSFVSCFLLKWAVVARARERAAFMHWVRLVLDKPTNQKSGFWSVTHAYRVLVAGRMQIKDRKTALSQLLKQLSEYWKITVNFYVNKAVASSERESSMKPDSGVWFIQWQCKVLIQSFVILLLDPYCL